MARPGAGLQLMQMLSRLGEGIGQIANPNQEQEAFFRRFLLENPERARSLLRSQQTGEAERAMQGLQGGGSLRGVMNLGEAAAQEPTNVGASFGLNPEETRSALQLAGTPSPEERLTELTAEELIGAGVPEQRAETITARLRGEEQQSLFDVKKFREFMDQGLPAAQAMAKTAVANFQTENAEFKEKATKFVDETFDELPLEEQRRFGFAVSNPGYLEDLQFREQLAADELLGRLKLRVQRGERLKDLVGLRIKLDDQLAEIEGTIRSEDLSDNEKRMLAARHRALTRLGRMVYPNNPEFTAGLDAGFFGKDVDFKPTEILSREESISGLAHMVTSGQMSLGDLVKMDEYRALPAEDQRAVTQRVNEASQPVQVRVGNWIERNIHPLIRGAGTVVRDPVGTLARGETLTADVTNDWIQFFFGERPIPRQGVIGGAIGLEPEERNEQ